jgi:hypothetical protein
VLPVRVSRTQYGAVAAAPPLCVVAPPLLARRWYASPLPGVTIIIPCAAPADVEARIITPALVQAWTFCTLATRAVIVPSPTIVW